MKRRRCTEHESSKLLIRNDAPLQIHKLKRTISIVMNCNHMRSFASFINRLTIRAHRKISNNKPQQQKAFHYRLQTRNLRPCDHLRCNINVVVIVTVAIVVMLLRCNVGVIIDPYLCAAANVWVPVAATNQSQLKWRTSNFATKLRASWWLIDSRRTHASWTRCALTHMVLCVCVCLLVKILGERAQKWQLNDNFTRHRKDYR